MVTDQQVKDFLKMSVFKKARLQQDDPAKYNELKAAASKNYNPTSDSEAAKELAEKK